MQVHSGLLNKLCKGISIILIEGIYVIWTLLSPSCQILILQTLPVAAVGEAAGEDQPSPSAFPAEELFCKLCKLNTSL